MDGFEACIHDQGLCQITANKCPLTYEFNCTGEGSRPRKIHATLRSHLEPREVQARCRLRGIREDLLEFPAVSTLERLSTSCLKVYMHETCASWQHGENGTRLDMLTPLRRLNSLLLPISTRGPADLCTTNAGMLWG